MSWLPRWLYPFTGPGVYAFQDMSTKAGQAHGPPQTVVERAEVGDDLRLGEDAVPLRAFPFQLLEPPTRRLLERRMVAPSHPR